MISQDAGKRQYKQTHTSAVIRSAKFLTFFLAEEEYGLEILKVQEILGLLPITRVPQAPEFMRGVINLRGKVIPTIDARLKFGMPAVEATNETCIIVVHVRGMDVGVIVDRVSEVIDIPEEQIEPPPSFGLGFNTDLILGIGKVQDRAKLLLNIDRIILADEFSRIEKTNTVTEKMAS